MLVTHFTLSLILLLPLKVSNDVDYFNNISSFLNFNFDYLFFLITVLLIIVLVFFSIYFVKNDNNDRYSKIYYDVLGTKKPIILSFLMIFFGAFFEELMFRGYIFVFFNIIFYKFGIDYNVAISIVLLSVVFSLFHITQGREGLVFSFILSIFLAILTYRSYSVWPAVLIHSLYNSIEIFYVYPVFLKKNSDLKKNK